MDDESGNVRSRKLGQSRGRQTSQQPEGGELGVKSNSELDAIISLGEERDEDEDGRGESNKGKNLKSNLILVIALWLIDFFWNL